MTQGYQIHITQKTPFFVPATDIESYHTVFSIKLCCVTHIAGKACLMSDFLGPGLCSVSSSCRAWSWPSSSSSLPFLSQIPFTTHNPECVYPQNSEDFTTGEILASLSPSGMTAFLTLLPLRPAVLSLLPGLGIRGEDSLKAFIGRVIRESN